MEVVKKDLGEDYEETKNLHFYYAFADRNEFSHKSTKISHFPSLKFYPRAKPGETKKKWINYKESLDYKGLERFIRKYATVELPEPEEDEEL